MIYRNWCLDLFNSLYNLSFSIINYYTYFSLFVIFVTVTSSCYLNWVSLSCWSRIISWFWLISSYFKRTVFYNVIACWSDSRSLSFIRVIWASRSVKFYVKWATFYWSDLSLAYVLHNCNSNALIVLDFSASISSNTWISISISFFCLSRSSNKVDNFLELNSYFANF